MWQKYSLFKWKILIYFNTCNYGYFDSKWNMIKNNWASKISAYYIPGGIKSFSIAILATIVVAYFHFNTNKPFHNIIHYFHYYLFYFIIIYMAHKFGLIGGILSSIVLSLIYNPKAYLIVFSGDKELIRPVLEILMMYTLAIFSGLFSQKIYCEKEKLKKVSEELKDSLVLLERSVEEKIKMEKEIAKADRLRVIGQLTAGIAHEIRNPLAAIRSGIKLLKNRKSNERIVDLVISEVDRLNSFVERFLQYASVGKSEDIEIRAKELFDEVRELTKLTCKNKKDIIFQSTLEIDGDVLIRGDKNYLKQALFNIVLNSIEACESMNYQGKVLVNGYFDEKAVFFKVSDNGPGISESVRDTIFEPFFTTKEKGTGLGLTIANKIIKEHDGEISIENNGGLRFIVKLLRYK